MKHCGGLPVLGAVVLWLLLAAGPAAAARVSGLYEAEVPVAGQDAGPRNEAIQEAFRRVLVKLTGNRAIVAQPALAADAGQAARYVEQYRYRMAPVTASAPGTAAAAADAPVVPQHLLKVQFDSAALNRLLRERGLAPWGDQRPTLLPWLVLDQAGQRRFLGPELDDAAYQSMTLAAEGRGVPLLFPLWDLEDQSRLQVADVWGGFADRLHAASERYGPDAIVSGRLLEVGPDLWRASWTLMIGSDSAVWDNEGPSREAIVAQAMDDAIDRLAARFVPASAAGGADRLWLRVAGVTSLHDYARLNRYLISQGAVEKADLLAVEADAVTFELIVRGSEQVLEQALTLGGLIRPEPQAAPAVPAAGDAAQTAPLAEVRTLHYRLQP